MKKNNVKESYSTPTVSIVMGVYRCKDPEALKQSVQSIINQTLQDWELLIVDDGSNDNGATSAAIRTVAKTDSRVIPLSYNVNHGLAYALNYCIERSHGNYIARQDADDYSESTRLQKQIEYLELNQDVAFVGSSAVVFDNFGEWGQYNVKETPNMKSFLWNSPFIHPSVIFRRVALESCGGYRVASETSRCEDYDLFMRLYAKGMIGYNIQENLYAYHIDRNEKKHRSMGDRINEVKVRSMGFKALGFGFESIPYLLKPIIIGFLPGIIMKKIRNAVY